MLSSASGSLRPARSDRQALEHTFCDGNDDVLGRGRVLREHEERLDDEHVLADVDPQAVGTRIHAGRPVTVLSWPARYQSRTMSRPSSSGTSAVGSGPSSRRSIM